MRILSIIFALAGIAVLTRTVVRASKDPRGQAEIEKSLRKARRAKKKKAEMRKHAKEIKELETNLNEAGT